MIELAPLARPYAQAAFEYAVAQKNVAQWADLLEALAQMVSQAVVQEMLSDPRYTIEQLTEIVLAFAPNKLSQEAENFIRLLAERRRLILLPDIAKLFAEYRAASEKRITVQARSALPLTSEERQSLQSLLTKRLQSEVVLDCQEDSSLIGGLYLRIGDKVIDSTIRGQLNRLKTQLLG